VIRSFKLVSVAVVLLLSTACQAADPDAGDRAESAPPSTAEPAASSTPAVPVWTSLDGPLQRCGPQPEGVRAAPFAPTVLRDRQVGRAPAVRLGRGRVAVVLLHQTDGNGLCGWLPFMPVAAEAGFAVLAIDLCRYGESDCTAVAEGTYTDADQTDAVAVAVRYARERLHARRVVVMGASMGGSVALMSAATLDGVDAVVDVSGPVDWGGMDVVRRGHALDVPAFVAMSVSEGPEEAAGAAEIVANAPSGSRLVTPDSGHGYVLLNDTEGAAVPLAREVLAWIGQHPRG
jgi:pimeloyl-ACP methyl ester carboxylesterase